MYLFSWSSPTSPRELLKAKADGLTVFHMTKLTEASLSPLGLTKTSGKN
jgi:hypothetical protein